ncbi:SRPBCC family protein [Luteolibacter soli]|uniref:SRPBCC family protein n=1 Tax=Luteolibacter soli TaxID=3135280 RepID=A0ABU9ARB4_9BACT
MPSATVSYPMPCSSAVVFELLHDYDRRLEWDTLLREARLTRGHTVAEKGATSLCVGKPFFGWIGIETRYLTFVPGSIAAVEMINRSPFFEHFAASIRHEDAPEGSRLTYKLNFSARPRFLRCLLHPVMLVALRYETRKRLAALAGFLREKGKPV